MPINKGRLIRRKVLDDCLSGNRNYTLLALMDKCNKAIREHGLKTVSSENTIRTDFIRRHKLPAPPFSEQDEIVAYHDSKCDRIDTTIAKAMREIELLRKFKQSVITEAVTGNIKVC